MKKLILTCLSIASFLNLSPSFALSPFDQMKATGTSSTTIQNIQHLTLQDNSKEISKTALMYIAGSATLLVGSYLAYKHAPKLKNTVNFAKNCTIHTATTVVNSLESCTDFLLKIGPAAWQNKQKLAKISGLTATMLLLNYLARGKDSSLSYIQEKGFRGIFPNIKDQFCATGTYTLDLFRRQN